MMVRKNFLHLVLLNILWFSLYLTFVWQHNYYYFETLGSSFFFFCYSLTRKNTKMKYLLWFGRVRNWLEFSWDSNVEKKFPGFLFYGIKTNLIKTLRIPNDLYINSFIFSLKKIEVATRGSQEMIFEGLSSENFILCFLYSGHCYKHFIYSLSITGSVSHKNKDF